MSRVDSSVPFLFCQFEESARSCPPPETIVGGHCSEKTALRTRECSGAMPTL